MSAMLHGVDLQQPVVASALAGHPEQGEQHLRQGSFIALSFMHTTVGTS